MYEFGEFVKTLLNNSMRALSRGARDIEESWRYIIRQGAQKIYPAHGKPFSAEAIKKMLGE